MVALAIVAIALPALLMALNQQIDDTAYLRDKTLAQMVASNKLAEMRLVIGATRSLQAGKSNGVATLLERDWYWWVQTLPTPVEKFFRVEISVALDPELQDQPLYQLTAFMNSDLAIDTEGLPDEDPGEGAGEQDNPTEVEDGDPDAGRLPPGDPDSLAGQEGARSGAPPLQRLRDRRSADE
jgi:general secretion pathway protein I